MLIRENTLANTFSLTRARWCRIYVNHTA